MKARTRIALLSLPLALAACATGRSAEPIEVTRFVAPQARAQLGDARLMVETAPGSPEQGLALEPYKEAVARELADTLRQHWNVDFDDAGAIGRRYRRQDEIGTPYCVTVDFDTLERTVKDSGRWYGELARTGVTP